MPCYLVQTVNVKFSVESRERLVESLKSLRMGVTRDQEDRVETYQFRFWLAGSRAGTVDFETSSSGDRRRANESLNAVKREYSRLTIEQIAKKRKWALKYNASPAKEVNLQLKRWG